jgi:hypothetical protein
MENIPEFDLQGVTCGLVPAMLDCLNKADADEVRIKVRQGIRTELWNSFGSGGDWEISIEDDLFCDVVRFRRAERKTLDPLGLMDF